MAARVARTVSFSLPERIERSDIPALTARVSALISGASATTVLCDVDRAPSDAVTAEALAKLKLAARRHGCRLIVRCTSSDLTSLLSFMGLDRVLLAG
jgi:hypothetical protein